MPSYPHGHSALSSASSRHSGDKGLSGVASVIPDTVCASTGATSVQSSPGLAIRHEPVGVRPQSTAVNTPGHAATSTDGHVAHDVDRFALTRVRCASAARDRRSAGTVSPVSKYISSGVCPKRRMRKYAVVLVDVEGDQTTDGRDAVQRVKEEPLMFQRAPPRFDHGVRELQLC